MDALHSQSLGERAPICAPATLDSALSDLLGLSPDLDQVISGNESARQLFAGTSQGSRYLKTLIRRFPDFAASVFRQPAEDLIQSVIVEAGSCWRSASGLPDLMERLRTEKARAALLTALCDLAGWWTTEDVTRQLDYQPPKLTVIEHYQEVIVKDDETGETTWFSSGSIGSTFLPGARFGDRNVANLHVL